MQSAEILVRIGHCALSTIYVGLMRDDIDHDGQDAEGGSTGQA